MRNKYQVHIVTALVLAALLVGAFSASFTFAKGATQASSTPSAKRANSQVVAMHTVNMQQVPAATSKSLSHSAAQMPFLTGVSPAVTLLFSLNQGLLMCKLGVKYISPFIGRADDIDTEGINVISMILRKVIDQYNFKTQILAASLRNTIHFHQSALAGADVATVPVSLFETLMNHPLTDKGMQLFDDDWKKLGIKKFPDAIR